MRRRLRTTRVAIRPWELPDSAYATGLNYRTRITKPHQDDLRTARLVSGLTVSFVAVGFLLGALSILPASARVSLFLLLTFALLGIAYTRFINPRPPLLHLLLFLALIGVSGLFILVDYAPTTSQAYILTFG